MVVGFTTTYAIGAYHHWCCEFESCSGRGVLNTSLCDKVCQWLVTDLWFSSGTAVSSTNKTDCHDIAKILLKVALSTIKPNQTKTLKSWGRTLVWYGQSTNVLACFQGYIFHMNLHLNFCLSWSQFMSYFDNCCIYKSRIKCSFILLF
jgi:hypothetical protein